ncbi:RNase H domain-containing protein [Trichonephila clavipes]|nr:RNase H domain-containing protein [Trichonephila clavipes]
MYLGLEVERPGLGGSFLIGGLEGARRCSYGDCFGDIRCDGNLSELPRIYSGIIIFTDSRSTLQDIQNGKCQISHKIIQSIDKIITERRSCTIQWIPAHVNILGNEKADELAKESRACPQSSNLSTPLDTNAVANRRLINDNFQYSIPALNINRRIALIITRHKTKHIKEIKISADGKRSYSNHCPSCLNVQLSPQHILSCLEIQARLFKISPKDSEDSIFTDKVVEVAEAALDSF